jgi:hypothetical protein
MPDTTAAFMAQTIDCRLYREILHIVSAALLFPFDSLGLIIDRLLQRCSSKVVEVMAVQRCSPR